MSTTVPTNYFNRGKPFYPLVVNYIALLHGFYELSMRGIILQAKPIPVEKIRESLPKDPNTDINRVLEVLKTGPTVLPRPLELKSEYQGNFIRIDIDEIAKDIMQNFSYLAPFMMRAAGSLLIMAYETTQKFRDKGLLWEFLRHCRNAAAHNGLFHFKKGEPRRPAEWGKFQIKATIQGMPLFGSKEIPGFLGPGDPIRLLWDIEQSYPDMKA